MTWCLTNIQGGSGSASNIKFLNIEMQSVTNPIIIDQNYCDQITPCKPQVPFPKPHLNLKIIFFLFFKKKEKKRRQLNYEPGFIYFQCKLQIINLFFLIVMTEICNPGEKCAVWKHQRDKCIGHCHQFWLQQELCMSGDCVAGYKSQTEWKRRNVQSLMQQCSIRSHWTCYTTMSLIAVGLLLYVDVTRDWLYDIYQISVCIYII